MEKNLKIILKIMWKERKMRTNILSNCGSINHKQNSDKNNHKSIQSSNTINLIYNINKEIWNYNDLFGEKFIKNRNSYS